MDGAANRFFDNVEIGHKSSLSNKNPFGLTLDHEQTYFEGANKDPRVRVALHLKEGDEIAYEIKENRVILTNASPRPDGHPFVTFDEWLGEADRKAYARL